MRHRSVRRTAATVLAAVTIAAVAGVTALGGSPGGAATVSQGLDCGIGGSQTMTVTGTAPSTAAQDSEFTVDLDVAQATAAGGKIKNLVWSFQAPAGSALVAGSATTVGTGTGSLGAVTTAISGSVVQLKVAGEIANGASFKPPTLRFKLLATGAAGTVLAMKVRTNPAYTLTALGSINVSCTAKNPVVSFTSTQITGATTTSGSTPVTPTTTPPPVSSVWSPTGPCGSVVTTPAPARSTSMTVVVAGGRGGQGGQVAGATGGSGGPGGQVTTTRAVTPGQVVSAVIGCNGSAGTSGSGPGGAGFSPGGPGGKGSGVLTSDHYGGGGGGTSAVCVGATCASGAGTPVAVAAGGGGGGSLNCSGTSVGTGGSGGGPGTVTAAPGGTGSGASGSNGGGGLHSSGGSGGVTSSGLSATGGTGGNGSQGSGTNSGGGGGGGGFAGGNGGSGTTGGAALCAGGGGGGGGSSWAKAGNTATSFASAPADGAVTVTFALAPVDVEPFATIGDFTDQQYADLLGRAPTTAESADWAQRLLGGQDTADDLIVSLLPANLTANDAKLVRLYLAYFDRPPDLSGFTYWRNRLNAGTSIQKASDLFATSNEFKTTYGSLTNTQFVALVYQNVLGRPGEPAGVEFWIDELNSGKRTRGKVMTDFSEANENRNRKAAHVGVARLYLAMLDRMPKKVEMDSAVAGVEASTQTVAEALLAAANPIRISPEYETRVL